MTRTEIPHSLVLFAVADPDLEVRGAGGGGGGGVFRLCRGGRACGGTRGGGGGGGGGGEYQFASAMWASAFVQN